MATNDLFEKLNRLRQNIGKSPLKSWKASKDKLIDAIQTLEEAGAVDVLPGAKVDVSPNPGDDPELLKALTPKPEEDESSDETPPIEEKKPTKVKSELARGVKADTYSAHSRKSLSDQRKREKDAERAAKKAEKKAAKKAEKKDKPKDEVDGKKDPEKAARQKKHIEDKREKRKKEGKLKPAKDKNPNEVTVADIARELDRDPKICRAKLRRHEAKLREKYPQDGDRWSFPTKAKKDIIKILTGEK